MVPHYYNYELMKRINGDTQMTDVWRLPAIAPWEKTCTKHPTQKPLGLLSRIILASTEPRATFETTDDRLTFLIHIPIHAGCENNLLSLANKKLSAGSEKNSISSEESSEEMPKSSEEKETRLKRTNIVQSILNAIGFNPQVTAAEIAMQAGVSSRAVEKRLKTMREEGVIRRVGATKGGYWEIITND